jgi:UDP-N-acetylglucosamine:LPS N-acetylglucosamine transferase
VGELEDIPDARLGPMLPNRRLHASNHYDFIGYVLTFDPADYADHQKVRASLGYDDSPTILVTIGGTSIGKPLLELSANCLPFIKREVPDARMLIVCGPRIDPQSVKTPEGVDGLEILGFVPRLYEHMAASDLVVAQGGGTTTLELTALRRPFLFFPLQGHFEQEIAVSGRLQRHGAGIRMQYADTTPEMLAREVVAQLGSAPSPPSIRTDGASAAAERILQAAAG